jgi:hypothetical protein
MVWTPPPTVARGTELGQSECKICGHTFSIKHLVPLSVSQHHLGKLANSAGLRLSLKLPFVLLTGYLGPKAVDDASENNTRPAQAETSHQSQLLRGICSDEACCAALNSCREEFPRQDHHF